MPIDLVVANASPLIALFKSGHAHLLGQLWPEIIVPASVWDEVVGTAKEDAAAKGLPHARWAKRTEVPNIASLVAAWDLGLGESEVLSFAHGNPGYRAMVDDAQARKCARSLGIPTLGAGAVLVLAKRHGFLPSVTDALTQLQKSGLWLSDRVIQILKDQAGEP